MYDERHAREMRILGLADGEAIDIEAARSQHAGNVCQNTGLVVHKGGKYVSHDINIFPASAGSQGASARVSRSQNHAVNGISCARLVKGWRS
jgi:hypothetical protein